MSATATSTKPSFLRIIQSDMIALIAAIAPVIFAVLYVAITYFGFLPGFRGKDPIAGETGAPFFLYGTLVALAVGLPVLIWRIRSVQQVFANGVEVPGRITNLVFHRDRGRVAYAYQFEGKDFAGANAIMKTGRTQTLQPGMQVVLIVERTNPNRALIRDLYV